MKPYDRQRSRIIRPVNQLTKGENAFFLSLSVILAGVFIAAYVVSFGFGPAPVTVPESKWADDYSKRHHPGSIQTTQEYYEFEKTLPDH